MFQHQIKHLAFEPQMQSNGLTFLNEEESSHLVRVLRMRAGERFHTTDGAGNLYEVEIVELRKKEVVLDTLKVTTHAKTPFPEIHVAIAPLKQIDRFEWFLEKAVEIGVTSIAPILTKRTERTVLKPDRLQKIMIAAMKQSQRFWAPKLHPIVPLEQYLNKISGSSTLKLMGWCGEEGSDHLPKASNKLLIGDEQSKNLPIQFLIGPEGDFTHEEAAQAKTAGFQSVSLGDFRLRTETAGIVAITLLQA